jgi:hypothetical protein
MLEILVMRGFGVAVASGARINRQIVLPRFTWLNYCDGR